MLRFFRNLRKSMIRENRVSKYMLYALGEIILVVAGILIALQIDNWNDERKLRDREMQVLGEIHSELEQALEDVTDDHEDHVRNNESTHLIIESFLDRRPYQDSMMLHFYLAGDEEIFRPKTSAFESLKSMGLELISNDSLRRILTTAYLYIEDFSGQKQELNDSAKELMALLESYAVVDRDRLENDPEYSNRAWINKRGHPFVFTDYEAFLDDDHFLELLMNTAGWRRVQIYELGMLMYGIPIALEAIEKEMNTLNPEEK